MTTTTRLEIRLDEEHRRRLKIIAEEQDTPVSETVRRLIDNAYEDALKERRRRAVERLVTLELEDVPDPKTLNRQLDGTHDLGDLY